MKLILLLAVLPAVAFAADAGAEPVAVAPDLATSLIQSLAARHPWLASVLAFIGTMRLVAKPVCMWLERRALATPDKADDLFIARARRTTAVRVLDFFLDLGFSVKRDTVARAVRKPKATLAGLLLLGALLYGQGCAALGDKWDSLSPAQQNAVKAAAKAALQLGLGELGSRVNELQPYTQRLAPLIETTFATPAADRPATLAAEVKRQVDAVVPEPDRPAVLTALRGALLSDAATASTPGQNRPDRRADRFKAALAAQL